MKKLQGIIKTVQENVAYNEELKAVNHLYRALRHAVKGRHLSEQEKARLGELAEYTRAQMISDLTIGEQMLVLSAALITIEALFIGAIFGLAALFPTLNGVSDLVIALSLLAIALIVTIPTTYLIVKPNGLIYRIAEKRYEHRDWWLYCLWHNTYEVQSLAKAQTIRN